MGNRCVIITAYMEGEAQYAPRASDIVLCADGGYAHALSMGVTPCKVIGDCDSLQKEEVPPSLLCLVPSEKDDTDTMLCIRHALELGCSECLLLGGIGGRFDHTFANIQTLAFAHKRGMRTTMQDAHAHICLLENEARAFARGGFDFISLFAYTQLCSGVCIEKVKYPLIDATLTQDFPLGVSNEFLEEEATVSVREGILLVVCAKK